MFGVSWTGHASTQERLPGYRSWLRASPTRSCQTFVECHLHQDPLASAAYRLGEGRLGTERLRRSCDPDPCRLLSGRHRGPRAALRSEILRGSKHDGILNEAGIACVVLRVNSDRPASEVRAYVADYNNDTAWRARRQHIALSGLRPAQADVTTHEALRLPGATFRTAALQGGARESPGRLPHLHPSRGRPGRRARPPRPRAHSRPGQAHREPVPGSLADPHPQQPARADRRAVHRCLHRALAQAVTWRLVAHNAAAHAVPPPRPHHKVGVLAPEQVAVLLDAADHTPSPWLGTWTVLRRRQAQGAGRRAGQVRCQRRDPHPATVRRPGAAPSPPPAAPVAPGHGPARHGQAALGGARPATPPGRAGPGVSHRARHPGQPQPRQPRLRPAGRQRRAGRPPGTCCAMR